MYVSAPGDPSPPSTSNFIPEFPRPMACSRSGKEFDLLVLGGGATGFRLRFYNRFLLGL